MSYQIQRPRMQACGFCKRNNEPPSVFLSHQLKDPRGQVTCPQLYKHRCELCGATGPEAHTRSYCPTVDSLRGLRLQQRRPQEEMAMTSNQALRPPTASSSSSASQSPKDSASPDHECRPREDFTMTLTGARICRNMRQVSHSKYNSAGKVRRPTKRPA